MSLFLIVYLTNFTLLTLGTENELLKKSYEILKKEHIKESSERKQLYNEVIELKGNIRVFCRCRPLNQNEIANGYKSVIEFDSSVDNELQVHCSDSTKKQFKFDHVFRPEDDQGTFALAPIVILCVNFFFLKIIF